MDTMSTSCIVTVDSKLPTLNANLVTTVIKLKTAMPTALSKEFAPSRSTFYIVSGLAIVALTTIGIKILRNRINQTKAVSSKSQQKGLLILYASQKGQSKVFAHELQDEARGVGLTAEAVSLSEFEPESLVNQVNKNFCVFILPTYTDGSPPAASQWFFSWLKDAASDFRYGADYFQGLEYCIVGLGNSLYGSNYCKVAKETDEWLAEMSAESFIDLTLCDEDVASSLHGSLQNDFSFWKDLFWSVVISGYKPKPKKRRVKRKAAKSAEKSACSGQSKSCECKKGTPNGTGEGCQSSDESDGEQQKPQNPIVDLEDMGPIMASSKDEPSEVREMVTPTIRKSLEKQGYKIIGSHSGVKLCRWTKASHQPSRYRVEVEDGSRGGDNQRCSGQPPEYDQPVQRCTWCHT
ncbi:TYW1 [Bugula neritina]|uniref:TYW1 n=1 Tax=Bugula neritina TaxID=10212 RepID=A0A7J7KI56_BUGNE|nr:TYW1 [Bugula neritina]